MGISGKPRQAEASSDDLRGPPSSERPNAYFWASLRWGLVARRWKLAATRAQIVAWCRVVGLPSLALSASKSSSTRESRFGSVVRISRISDASTCMRAYSLRARPRSGWSSKVRLNGLITVRFLGL